MNKTKRTVFTVGHSTHTSEALVALLRRHRIDALADVRSTPHSRFNPQFNRNALADALGAESIRYVWLGDKLGGRSNDPSCYKDRRIQYDRVAATESFQRSLNRVIDGAAQYRIALMCAEKEPLECHRTLLVARALDERGIDIFHIHADGALESHTDAMDRLLDTLKLHRQDLYATRNDMIATAVALQAERVAYVDASMATANLEQHP